MKAEDIFKKKIVIFFLTYCIGIIIGGIIIDTFNLSITIDLIGHSFPKKLLDMIFILSIPYFIGRIFLKLIFNH